MNRAVFFDRDGTLNVEAHYLSDPEHLVLIPGIEAALKELAQAGYLLFIVTNQSGIGRGLYSEADMHRVHEALILRLEPFEVQFQAIYFSPEHPTEPSPGRKPSPFFLQKASRDYGVDLAQSYMVGDKRIDVECGWNAGVKRSILVETGYGTQQRGEVEALSMVPMKPLAVVPSAVEAVQFILEDEGGA